MIQTNLSMGQNRCTDIEKRLVIAKEEESRERDKLGVRGNGTPLQYSCLGNPWMEEPGRLQSMGSLRIGHD